MKKDSNVQNGQKNFPAFDHRWIMDFNPVSGQRKHRRISNPNSLMRQVHARLINYIRQLRIPMPNSSAGRRGDSALKNVLRHRKVGGGMQGSFNRYLILLDISSAYQAVDLDRMVDVFILVNPDLSSKRDDVRSFLHDYCFDPKMGGLVTGAPASPDLFNLYCEVLIDRPLRVLCERYGLVYSRYIDDLTFSSVPRGERLGGPIGLKKRQAIRAVIESVGFKVSDKKAQVIDLKMGPAVVNGVGICLNGRIFLPRHTLRLINGLLYQAVNHGKINPAVIHGKMGLLKSVSSPQTANATERKVYALYDEFRRLNSNAAKK